MSLARKAFCIRAAVRTGTLILAGHFVGHSTWYAFSHASHAIGVDPAAIGALAAGPLGIPIGVGIVLAGTTVEDRLHRRAEAPRTVEAVQ